MDESNQVKIPTAKIAVVGVGGGGGNAVNRIYDKFTDVDFIAINTDLQDLQKSVVPYRLEIGLNTTKGRGAGANPELGQQAAEESRELIKIYLENADLVIITAGMGKGTGTGASPVVASIAKEMGKLVIAVVTTPFYLEGKHRIINAEIGIENLAKVADAYIVVANENLVSFSGKESIGNAFKYADSVLSQCILGISDVILNNQTFNLDFADLCTVLKGMGRAYLGIGAGKGDDRVMQAIRNAATNKLQNLKIDHATSVLLYLKAKPEVTMKEVDEAIVLVREVVDKDANIIFGIDMQGDNINGDNDVEIMIIATGFERNTKSARAAQPAEAPAQLDIFGGSAPKAEGAEVGEKPAFVHQAPPVSRVSVSEDSEEDDVPAWLKIADKSKTKDDTRKE